MRNRGLTPIFWLAVLLAGCSSTPKPAPSPASAGGKFYQNDGPPREVPANLLQTPDAVPRVEPFAKATLRPYTVLGRSYTPIAEDTPFRQRGLASWYGRQFHGARTANGEIYDMFAMTAAHPTLPLPSYAQVTNVKTGASAIVRINDRGPFHDGRIIDLSYVAAQRLGILSTAEVEVVRFTHADIASGRWRQETQIAAASPPPPQAPSTATATATRAPVALPAGPVATPPLDPVEPTAVASGGWAVQLGAFAQAVNAESSRDTLAAALQRAGNELTPRVEHDGTVYRVLVGAAADRAAAAALAARLESLLARDVALYRRPQ